MGRILKVEEPYAHVVSRECVNTVCSSCMKRPEVPLKQCQGCKFVRYCDKNCQRKDWADHKSECVLLARAPPGILDDTVRLLARIILKRKRSVPRAFNGRTFDSLSSGVGGGINVAECSVLKAACCRLLGLYIGYTNFPTPVELSLVYDKVVTNRCYIGIDGPFVSGLGIYIGVSELERSCERDVDAYSVFDGNKIVVRAMKEEITEYNPNMRIAYGCLRMFPLVHCDSFVERLPMSCECLASDNEDKDSEARSLRCAYCENGYCPLNRNADVATVKPKCALCGKVTPIKVDEAFRIMDRMCEEFAASSTVPPPLTVSHQESMSLPSLDVLRDLYEEGKKLLSLRNRLLYSLSIILMGMADCKGFYDLASEIAERMLISDRIFFHEHSPQIGKGNFLAGIYHAKVGNLALARDRLQKAVDLSAAAHGPEHEMTKRVEKELLALHEI